MTALGNFKDSTVIDKPAEKLHYYTPEQFCAFIKEAKKHTSTITDWGYYVFFNIAFYTGARKGEINALKWSDIDENIMHIRRSIAQKLKGGDAETPPKNKSSYRDMQIPLPLLKVLNDHKERQRATSHLFSKTTVCAAANNPSAIHQLRTTIKHLRKLPTCHISESTIFDIETI